MTDLENREAFERAFKKEHSGVSFWLNTWNDVEQDYNHLTASWAWRMWNASAQREGFKLVPLEPTIVMLNQVETEKECFFEVAADSYNVGISACTCAEIYKAMINAV